MLQVERTILCPPSDYQTHLCSLVMQGLQEASKKSQPQVRSVTNSVMELRNISNHPFLVRSQRYVAFPCRAPSVRMHLNSRVQSIWYDCCLYCVLHRGRHLDMWMAARNRYSDHLWNLGFRDMTDGACRIPCSLQGMWTTARTAVLHSKCDLPDQACCASYSPPCTWMAAKACCQRTPCLLRCVCAAS